MKMEGPKLIFEAKNCSLASRKQRIFRGKIFLKKGERKLETEAVLIILNPFLAKSLFIALGWKLRKMISSLFSTGDKSLK